MVIMFYAGSEARHLTATLFARVNYGYIDLSMDNAALRNDSADSRVVLVRICPNVPEYAPICPNAAFHETRDIDRCQSK